MTEAEWLTCSDPGVMLGRRGNISERKLILFACACCRRQRRLFNSETWKRAVETAERFADGLCAEPELRGVRAAVEAANPDFWSHGKKTYIEFAAYFTTLTDEAAAQFGESSGPFDDIHAQLADCVAGHIACATYPMNARERELIDKATQSGDLRTIDFSHFEEAVALESAAQSDILRDLLGNPFRPMRADLVWLVPAVRSLAGSIRNDRAFERMPDLANVLGQAGCHDTDILAHCRGSGPHVRGCWVVDLLLDNA